MSKFLDEMICRIINEESVNINEFFTDDMKFTVYQTLLKQFVTELKKHKFLQITNKEKDGGYFNITVFNSGPADSWDDFIEFYKSKIKI